MTENGGSLRDAAWPSGDWPFQQVPHSARIPLVAVRRGDGRNPILRANDAFLAFSGYTRPEVVGRSADFLTIDARGAMGIRSLLDSAALGLSSSIRIICVPRD